MCSRQRLTLTLAFVCSGGYLKNGYNRIKRESILVVIWDEVDEEITLTFRHTLFNPRVMLEWAVAWI